MRVKLIDHQENALDLLLFTRSTRLNMSPEGLEEIAAWPYEQKMEELEKARNTIQSSWEFINYIFVIENVTRAFTHQFVRTRSASFAQQSQRMVDMSGFSYETGPSIKANGKAEELYEQTMLGIQRSYHLLIDAHRVDTQDARGVLPTNIHTNITVMANLRTLHDMALKRLCVRTQGEYQEVFQAIRSEVIMVHPWAEDFIHVQCAWDGTCAFPLFDQGKCTIKPVVYDPTTALSYNGGQPWTTSVIRDYLDRYSFQRTGAQPTK